MTALLRERPILFSGPMVRAILAGTKTQTRRLARRDVEFRGGGGSLGADWNDPSCWGWADEYGDECALAKGPQVDRVIPCPYGEPGERLWVRETFQLESNSGFGDEYAPPFTDGRPVKWTEDAEEGRYWQQAHYRATDPDPELSCDRDGCATAEPHGHWQPSIYMPRWASRITLEVTGVRVERLQAITEDDARAEGVAPLDHIGSDQVILGEPRGERTHGTHPHILAFAVLWDEINGTRAPWVSNPWVWVVSFAVRG